MTLESRGNELMTIDWVSLINAASICCTAPLKADLCLGALKCTGWRPVKLRVEGGGEFAVKGLWRCPTHDNLPPGRTMFNENVVGRLGRFMLAPVPEVALVYVSQELIDQSTGVMGHLRSGIAHGSRLIENSTPAEPKHQMRCPIEPQNRPRFAHLAVLFGWTNVSDDSKINDAEFLYDQGSNVHGVDFGNFFGGPKWEKFAQLNSRATPKAWIGSKLVPGELDDASQHLRDLTPEQIACAVAAPPVEWGVTFDERVMLATLLHARQAMRHRLSVGERYVAQPVGRDL